MHTCSSRETCRAFPHEQAWQTIHPPRRGKGLRRPKVHIGFHKSWTANDLHIRVRERVMELIKGHKGTTKMYITGEPLSVNITITHAVPCSMYITGA